MRRLMGWVVLLGLGSMTQPAAATFSVVAAEPATGRVGGAGASCIGDYSVTVIYGSVPGRGALHAQAALADATKALGVQLLQQGEAPAAIITAITDPGFDPGATTRQYAVLDLTGAVASYTGPDTGPHASHRSGEVDGVTFAIQGNILTGVEVLERMEVAFAEGCDLPERLMRALEAGGMKGEGDSRCTPDLPADSGFMRVETAEGGRVLDVDHTGTSPDDPVVLLRADYDAWRAEHPCPEPGGAGGATSEGVGGSAPPPTPNDDATQDAGCTLRAGPTTSLAIVAATAALALASRRRRRHR